MANFSQYNPKVTLHFVVSESFNNGPIISFSASLEATRSVGEFSTTWGISNYEITSFNRIRLNNVTTTTSSNILGWFGASEIYAGVDYEATCSQILTNYITGADVYTLFSSSGVLLQPYPTGTIYIVTSSLQFPATAVDSQSIDLSFGVSARYLVTGSLTITPPSQFKISFTSGSGYTTGSLILSQSSYATVSSSTVHVVFTPTSIGDYNYYITCSVVSGSNQYVNVSGSGI